MNEILQKVRFPAIGLLIVGALNALVGLLVLVSGLIRYFGGQREQIPVNEAERFGYYAATGFGYGVGFFSLLLAPVIIFGAVKMLGGKKLGLARVAAVLAILPFSSCCFVLGIPFGIWALIVLRKPEVKAFFQNGGGSNSGGASPFNTPPAPPPAF